MDSNHFTYADKIDCEHLWQGDLLRRTEEISNLLKEVHPYYLKPDYKYFLILTQSCDLKRRDGKPCSSDYISFAAVRPFDAVLEREASLSQKENFEKRARICRRNKKNYLKEFIRRILNNNYKEYFYLHDDNLLELHEPCCAFLRLSIAIRSEHYEKCLKAKFLELTEEFRAKLGWAVGNLFSRIGTRDWVPTVMQEPDFENFIEEILDRKFVWFEPEIVNATAKYFSEKKISPESLSQDKIIEIAKSIRLPTKEENKQRVLKSIKRILEKQHAIADGIDIQYLLNLIEQDAVFKSCIK